MSQQPAVTLTQLPDIHEQLCQQSLAYFAREVLEMEVVEMHCDWSEAVAGYDRLILQAARDHGKCTTGDALILAADGRRIRTDEWTGGDVLAYDPATGRLARAWSPASKPNGIRPCLRVTTRTGRSVTVTRNHPFRKFGDWCHAEDLVLGDRVAVPRVLPVEATDVADMPWLLGLMIGDGDMHGTLRVTIADPKLIEAAREAVEARGWVFTKARGCRHAFRVHSAWRRSDSPKEWARRYGCLNVGAYDKRVPAQMFVADLASVGEFLAGYLDSDAHVAMQAGGSVEYYSVSEGLLRDVQHLLLRIGVSAVIGRKNGRYKGQAHKSWRLTIRGKDVVTFSKVVHPRGARAGALADLVEQQVARGPCSGPAIDRFPREVWGLIKHSRHWFEKRGLPRPSPAYEPTREKLDLVAAADGNDALLTAARSDVIWDEVVGIEDAGDLATWSVCVPGLENYVANDIVNHNSAFLTYAYPIWQAWRDPGSLGLILSANGELAGDLLDIIRFGNKTLHGIYDHPQLGWMVDEADREVATKDRWARQKAKKRKNEFSRRQIRFANGSIIRARGYGSRLRSGHPHWVVADDVLDESDLYSEIQREKKKTYFRTAIINMVLKGGQIIGVGTPFHQSDLYQWLAQNDAYHNLRFPGLIEDPKGIVDPRTGKTYRALYPERHTVQDLLKKRIEIGDVAFAREILLQPITDDMSLFPSTLFVGNVMSYAIPWAPTAEAIRAAGWDIYVGVDFAISASSGADYTVITVLAMDQFGNRTVIDSRRFKGKGFEEQKEAILQINAIYQPMLIVVEANAMQRIFGADLIKYSDAPIKQFETQAQNKNSLVNGVPSLRILLENAKLRFARGDRAAVEATNVYISELMAFGYFQGKLQGTGEHDDCVMSLWLAVEASRLGGFKFGFAGADGTAPAPIVASTPTPEAATQTDERAAVAALDQQRLRMGGGF